jgi:hypothetical protein
MVGSPVLFSNGWKMAQSGGGMVRGKKQIVDSAQSRLLCRTLQAQPTPMMIALKKGSGTKKTISNRNIVLLPPCN